MKKVLFCILMLPFFVFAEANNLQKNIQKCSTIGDDFLRLQCYDDSWISGNTSFHNKVVSCLKNGFNSPNKKLYCFDNINKGVDISKMGKWHWKIIPSQSYVNTSTLQVSTPEKADYIEIYTYPEESPIDGKLVITCKRKQTGLYINKIGEHHPLPIKAKIISASFDENSAEQWNDWILYEDKIIYNLYLNNKSNSKNIIFELENHKKLKVFMANLQSTNGDIQYFTYNMTGLEYAIAPFKNMCKMTLF